VEFFHKQESTLSDYTLNISEMETSESKQRKYLVTQTCLNNRIKLC